MSELCKCSESCSKVASLVTGQLTDDLQLLRMAEIFQCFADPVRLKIINSLLIKELCVCDLTEIVKMTQPAVSHHLKHLRQMHLVKCRRAGKSILYSLDDYHIQLLFDMCKSHLLEDRHEEEADHA